MVNSYDPSAYAAALRQIAGGFVALADAVDAQRVAAPTPPEATKVAASPQPEPETPKVDEPTVARSTLIDILTRVTQEKGREATQALLVAHGTGEPALKAVPVENFNALYDAAEKALSA